MTLGNDGEEKYRGMERKEKSWNLISRFPFSVTPVGISVPSLVGVEVADVRVTAHSVQQAVCT